MQAQAKIVPGVTVRKVGPFLLLAFGLTWGLAALFLLFPDPFIALFGEISMKNPALILAVYSPGIAGVFLVWRWFGVRGLGSFFQRLGLWRGPGVWWLFVILGIPAVFYAGAAVKGPVSAPLSYTTWGEFFPALTLALFLGPIEEFGWRGVALPLLQRRFSPFGAGLLLGICWGVWHIPAFMLSGSAQSAWSFAPFFVGIVAISVMMTPLFNAARGSLLLPVIFHFQMNNPLWPDAQPWDTLFFVAAAVVIVWLNRTSIFQSGGGVTEILMPGAGDGR